VKSSAKLIVAPKVASYLFFCQLLIVTTITPARLPAIMPDHLTHEDIPKGYGRYRGATTAERMRNSMRAAERVRPPTWSRALHVGSIVLCAGK
jgi:hypothetical protein